MKKSRLLGAVCTACLSIGIFLLSNPVNAVVMDFEALPTSSGGGVPVPSVTEDGFTIIPVSGSRMAALQDGWQSGRGSSNGTNTIYTWDNASPTSGFVLTAVNGLGFSISSIDVAEVFKPSDGGWSNAADSVVFTGTKSGGSIISNIFSLDKINDGPGGLTDFETFNFSSDWKDLISIEILGENDLSNTYINFDNIVVSQVPIPPALWLFGSGLLGLVGIARKKAA